MNHMQFVWHTLKKRSGNKENRNYSEMVHGKQTKIKQTQHDK